MPTATRTTTQQAQLDDAIRRAVEKYGEYMSGPDVQAYAGISSTTLYRWRHDNIGPEAFPLGRRWRYDTRAVVKFVRHAAN